MSDCRKATELASQAMDRPLRLGERLWLEFHLLICKGCTNCRDQMHFVRTAARKFNGKHGSRGGKYDPPAT